MENEPCDCAFCKEFREKSSIFETYRKYQDSPNEDLDIKKGKRNAIFWEWSSQKELVKLVDSLPEEIKNKLSRSISTTILKKWFQTEFDEDDDYNDE